VLLAFIVAAVAIYLAGVSPVAAGQALMEGSLTNLNGLGTTAIRTTPLILAGLGVAVGIRCGLWNLGAEGQIYVGGLTGTVAGLFVGDALPAPLGIALALIAGFAGGALWALIPGVLRAYRGVSEVITSLLLNFVGINVVIILIEGPLADHTASHPSTETLSPALSLPILLGGTQFHAGLVIAVAVAVALFILFEYTNLGLDFRAVGHNPLAALGAGIPARRRILQAMLLSGGLAGLAGATEILGLFHRLPEGFSPGYGFDAIAVALLAFGDPRFVLLSATFFGALRAGAPAMQILAGVPSALIFVTEGLVVMFVVMGTALARWARTRLGSVEVGDP
jgi:simple sugar transport system permease protein